MEVSEIENIRQAMRDFLNESELNKVPELNLTRIFDSPLVGIADTSDPLFLKLKDPRVIGAEYLLPSEWLPGAQWGPSSPKEKLSSCVPGTVMNRLSQNMPPGMDAENARQQFPVRRGCLL